MGPKDESPPKEERVLKIIKTPAQSVRTADLALVGDGDQLKLYLATENMKVGDILKTSEFIPRIPGNEDVHILLIWEQKSLL